MMHFRSWTIHLWLALLFIPGTYCRSYKELRPKKMDSHQGGPLSFFDSGLHPKFARLHELVYKINASYNAQSYLRTYHDRLEESTALEFAQSTISQRSNSIRSYLEEMHYLIVPSKGLFHEKGVLELFARFLTHGRYTCDLNRSVYDLTWDLYNIISHTEKKGYLTIAFAFELLREFKFGNYTIEYRFLENALADHNQEKMWSVQALLPQVSRVVRRCDPPKQIEGVTYLRMTQLLQGFLINEVDMNTKKTCKKECQDYKVATETSCFNQLFCSKQRSCNGRLFDCTFYDADSWVCMSDTEERRYDWVHYEQGTLLGKKEGRCINKIKVDSWWRWLLYHCSYCLCKCDAPSPSSDRYWSLKPSESDLSSNKVVTGLRFVKKGRVLGLEVQQARALPEAFIDGQTKEWVESKDAIDVNNSELKNVDFMEMSYEQRAMDLDVIDAPEGHVVTGARFRNIGGHLNLEMKVTPIDYSTGKLIVEASSWIGNDITPATSPAREFMDIPYPDVPTNYNGTSLLIAERDQYIMFDTTSGDKDVMQTTIPFIDSQPVETDTWLSGLGIYYKGTIGYGGYIGASVYNYDFSQYFKL
eukprot:TRINITY_DN1860_c0_g1_i1.p1 TRINITY_DN1860_c0_g1~~TRINITY_DN1860_c0_g1_i1.p1  ORF type:complete len:587 (-),score=112.25 TRINITY_DN1860_c0_g1_i1:142-1902(-)